MSDAEGGDAYSTFDEIEGEAQSSPRLIVTARARAPSRLGDDDPEPPERLARRRLCEGVAAVRELVGDAAARVARMLEALADGDVGLAFEIGEALEHTTFTTRSKRLKSPTRPSGGGPRDGRTEQPILRERHLHRRRAGAETAT